MALDLPAPPTDLNRRASKLARVPGPLYRIQPTGLPPLLFSKGTGRFNDPYAKFGVVYAALSPEGAFAEVFFRNLSRLVIPEDSIRTSVLSVITLRRSLRCVDLSGSGLRSLSCDARIATELPYSTTQAWSATLHAHPAKADGLLYRSRHDPSQLCVAVFSRARKAMGRVQSKSLLDEPLQDWTTRMVELYGLALD